MSSSAVQLPSGPPTGGIETVESRGNNCELKWIIDQFPFRFKNSTFLVSPPFECSGIQWELVMQTNYLVNPWREATCGLLLRGSTITASTSSTLRTIAYKITLLDNYGSPRKVRFGEDEFRGSIFHVAPEVLVITDIFDDSDVSDSDVFSFHLEMMIKVTPSEL